MKNDQFVKSTLVVKEYTDLHIQDDLFCLQNKTIAQLIEETDEEEKNEENTTIPNSG